MLANNTQSCKFKIGNQTSIYCSGSNYQPTFSEFTVQYFVIKERGLISQSIACSYCTHIFQIGKDENACDGSTHSLFVQTYHFQQAK